MLTINYTTYRSSLHKWLNKSLSFVVMYSTLFALSMSFATKGIAQTTCGPVSFKVTLVEVKYLNGQTTFIWSVYNPAPGNGKDGTTLQDLSHWGFYLGPCVDATKIIGGGISYDGTNFSPYTPKYGPDKSQTCTGTQPVVKFDVGTSGSNITYYKIIMSGEFTSGTSTAYFKYGQRCCTTTFPGIVCPPPKKVYCPESKEIECPKNPYEHFGTPKFTSSCDSYLDVTYKDEVNEYDKCAKKYTRTWTAKDDCGNKAYCSQTITVVDKTAPVVKYCPPAKTIQCPAKPVFDQPQFWDACDQYLDVTYEDKVDYTYKCAVKHIRIWTAKDDCGNKAYCTQVITVVDKTAPVVKYCPPAKKIECGGALQFDQPQFWDACDNELYITYSNKKEIIDYCTYKVTRTWVAKDDCGNKAYCSQVITVEDKTAPVVKYCPPDQTVECGFAYSFGKPIFWDACDKYLTITYEDKKTVVDYCTEKITRTWTAKDDCGHKAYCSQTITVTDTKPPVIYCKPDKTIECKDAVVFDPPTAYDKCDAYPEIKIVSTTVEGNVHTRTWVAIDNCGNKAYCSQKITVKPCPKYEGCTPGYWKNHPESWCGNYPTSADFFTTFGISNHRGLGDNLTLIAAAGYEGGGYAALARHAAAALQNACHSGVAYRYAEADIKKAVQDMFNSGSATLNGVSYSDVEALKDVLDQANNAGCPLGNNNPSLSANRPTRDITKLEQAFNGLTVTSTPNPFYDRIRFVIESKQSGQGSLEVFNMLGQKVKTVFQGYVQADRSMTLEYNVPATQKQNLIYVFRVGSHQTTGKLLSRR